MDYGVFLPVSGAAATRAGLKHAAETAERLYRDPVYWAKVAATIDTLSGGRACTATPGSPTLRV